jgi:hypothetical protein
MVISKLKLQLPRTLAGMALLIAMGTGCSQLTSIWGTVSEEVAAQPATDETVTPARPATAVETVELADAEKDSIDALKKVLLILPFRDVSKYKGPWDIYGQLARGLADTLGRYKAYRIIPPDSGFVRLGKKERLGKIESGRAVHLGRQLEADVVVLGEIEDISMKRFRATVPLGGYRSYQGISAIKIFFYNAIDGQPTGEYRCEGQIDSKRTGVVNPAAHVPLDKEYFLLGEAEWGSAEFHKTLVGQSVGECLHQLGVGVGATVRPAPELSVSEPKIIDIDASRAYINVGSADGVRNGDKFGVWDLGRELRDPETDTVLGYAVSRRVGVIQVEQVLNEHLSQVNILEGQGEIEPAFSIRAE